MVIGEAIRTSLEEIRGHKLRSGLTLSGVVLGTVALVVVLSVLGGVSRAVWKGFDDLGYDGVLLVSSKTPVDSVQRSKAYQSRGLRTEDETFFGDHDTLSAVAPVGESRAIITANGKSRRVTIYGVTPAYSFAKNRKAGEGRFISDRDQREIAAICVLGYKLKQQLFGPQDAVGHQVTIDGRRLTVAGVVTKFNMEMVNDSQMRQETEGLYVPLSAYQTMYGKKNSISYMIVKSADFDQSMAAEDDARRVLSRAHHGIGDVKIENVGKDILEERGRVVVLLHNWLIVFFSIAGVSLLIGGVGIFSVLKISISERLFEIGLRKSMGATDGEIFFQFLIESVTLSAIGASIGGLLGTLIVKLISSKFPAGLPLSGLGIGVAAGFAVFIGLFAGLYPSLTASRLEPVEALRS